MFETNLQRIIYEVLAVNSSTIKPLNRLTNAHYETQRNFGQKFYAIGLQTFS